MNKILFLILIVTSLYSSQEKLNVETILKTIPKNSPEYSLDLLYAKKIKTLKFIKDTFSTSTIKDGHSYIKAFKKLVIYTKFLANSNNHINKLHKKILILSSLDTPTQKLEYLYYKKLIDIAKNKKSYIKDSLPKWKKSLYDKLFDTKFDLKKDKLNIKLYLQKFEKLEKETEQLNINLEKWKIAENERMIKVVTKQIEDNFSKKRYILEKIANSYLDIFFQNIKDRDKTAFKTEFLIEKYTTQDKKAYKILLNFYEKKRFGNTQLILNKTTDEIKLTLHRIWGVLNYPLFTVDKKDISLINFFIFIFFLILGSYMGKYYKKSVYSLKQKQDISNSTITLLANIGYYLILVTAFLISLKSMGLNLSSFTLIAGALSVGIGFGLQNIVSNFISGIILMFEKSIKIGDYIQIDAETRGTVVDIKMRSITIRTNDNIDLIVPNQNFIQNIVTNWTLNDNSRRFRIPFGVSYGTSTDDVEKIVLVALKNSKFPHYKIGDKKPRIIFTSMGDSSINFELFVWVKGELTLRPRYTTSEFLKIIYKALNDANINIPFPQQDIYIKELPPIRGKDQSPEQT